MIASSSETVVLTAHVWKGDTEITGDITSTHFSWKRRSGRTDLDATWNSAHTGTKQVTMVQSDLNGNIGVDCVLRLETVSATYGSASVTMSTMNARHTRGTADANDRFSLVEDNMLKVAGTGNVGKYSLDDGVLKAQTDVTASVNILTEIPNKTVSFEYNAQGLRTKKTVTLLGKVTETEYILHGKLVTEMVVRKYEESNPTNITQTDRLHFFYDAQSRPAKVEYNGEMYSYLHNLQGDIVGIVDAGGQTVVKYSYDAWGSPLGTNVFIQTILAVVNPFRYRGYIYDEETLLYYLRSRFYSNEVQFICFDGEIVRALLKCNGRVYCNNNPVVLSDSDGMEGTYSLVFNVYTAIEGHKNGHYDITIISEGEDDLSFLGFSPGTKVVTMSFGPAGEPFEMDGYSVRRSKITIMAGNRTIPKVADERYLLLSGIQKGVLSAFQYWFLNEYSSKDEQNAHTYLVTYATQDIYNEDKYEPMIGYCGSGILFLVDVIREISSFTKKAQVHGDLPGLVKCFTQNVITVQTFMGKEFSTKFFLERY